MNTLLIAASALIATLLFSSAASAQPAGRPVAARPVPREAFAALDMVVASDRRPMPAWVKWGLVGAGGGAIAFALLGRARIDREPNPVLQDAALGALTGFVVIGGAVAFYSWICSPTSRSRRAGLCGR